MSFPVTNDEWLAAVTAPFLYRLRQDVPDVRLLRSLWFQPMSMSNVGPAPMMGFVGFAFMVVFARGEEVFEQAWLLRVIDDDGSVADPDETAVKAAESLLEMRSRRIEEGTLLRKELN